MAILVIAKMHNLHDVFNFFLYKTQVLSQLQLKTIICHHHPQCNHITTFAIVAFTRVPFGFMSLPKKKSYKRHNLHKHSKSKEKRSVQTLVHSSNCVRVQTQ
jgi:hypothetical protein